MYSFFGVRERVAGCMFCAAKKEYQKETKRVSILRLVERDLAVLRELDRWRL